MGQELTAIGITYKINIHITATIKKLSIFNSNVLTIYNSYAYVSKHLLKCLESNNNNTVCLQQKKKNVMRNKL